jgi:hypothetical protein
MKLNLMTGATGNCSGWKTSGNYRKGPHHDCCVLFVNIEGMRAAAKKGNAKTVENVYFEVALI